MGLGLGAAIAGGSLVSGILGDRSARRASRATDRASRRAIEEQRRQFDLVRADTAPYRQAGVNALGQLQGELAGGFQETPGFQFRVDQANRALERRQAAGGNFLSGAALRGVSELNQNLAADEYGNYFNRLAMLSGFGPNAVNTSASAGGNAANSISNSLNQAGQARGNYMMQGGAALNNAIQGGLQNYMLMNYLNSPSGTGSVWT